MQSTRCLLRQCKPSRCPQSVRSFSTTIRHQSNDVRIVEVGPRDGLQNEKTSIPLETKLELIRRLAQTGVRDVEVGSFIAPKWVPQMANSADILNHLLGHPPQSNHHMRYNFLVPNMRGLENYLKASDQKQSNETPSKEAPPAGNTSSQDPNEMPSGNTNEPIEPHPSMKQEKNAPASNTSTQDPNEMPSKASSSPSFSTEISLFAAATEAFSKANTNCTIAESLERCKSITALAKSRGVRVRGYISVALGCPYEGPDVSPQKVAEITRSLLEMGADEVSVADTTGMGTAPRTRNLLKALAAAGIANQDLALHFHDTYGQALINTMVGLDHGIRTFDSSVGGLGGCPYSKGATGNVATEDLNYLLHSLGMETGIETSKMAEIGSWICKEIGKANDSRAGKALLARLNS